MSEYIISDEVLASIRAACYEAGKRQAKRFTVRNADGEEIVRCMDCKKRRRRLEFGKYWCKYLCRYVYPDAFCAWGEK